MEQDEITELLRSIDYVGGEACSKVKKVKLASLSSGGKDSSYALWLASKAGHEIVQIVAMIPERADSWMFHFSNVHMIDLFAECSNLPLIKGRTGGIKERELNDLKSNLRGLEVDGVVSGAVASVYQKSRIERICSELGLASFTPLWGRNQLELLRGMVDDDFEVMITSVSARGLDEDWLGRKIDEDCIEDLEELQKRFGINPAGEGGEYETIVLDAPFFKKRISPIEANKVWKGDMGHLVIERAETIEKL